MSIIKVVYFDEESASDYLDISAGGKAVASSEDVRDRTSELHGKMQAEVAAKFSWLPFLGGSAGVAGGAEIAQSGQSLLRKTLSNTILTDYLGSAAKDERVQKLTKLRVTAPEGSMAFAKMFTPYMVMLRMEDAPIDLARMDETLAGAKGYYELLGEDSGGTIHVLRFNIKAFRNNYGLADLGRMNLTFHGVLVGRTANKALDMKAEMAVGANEALPSAADIVDEKPTREDLLLNVYDVLFAGVEHVG
ncbi:DUF6414 family protein [Pseudonocardia sp. NPDC049635]|uniref:DUF6414 family protein n=1 Tax=Pseudonocardia sp. NPDC049635 TaxID=3155506 RepID=UPI0033E56E28